AITRRLYRGLLGVVLAGVMVGCSKTKDRSGKGDDGDKVSFRAKPGPAVQNDLEQIGKAFHLYSTDHNRLPLAGPSRTPSKDLPWRVALLPHLGADPLFNNITNDLRKQGQVGLEFWVRSELLQYRPKVYAAGADVPDTHTCYRVFVGGGAAFEPNQ